MRRLIGIAVAAVALGPISGCGLGLRKMEGEPLWVVGMATRTYKAPSHRVALATLEAMRSEFPEADLARDKDLAFSPANELKKPDGSFPKEGDASVPADFPAVWNDWKLPEGGRSDRRPMILLSCHYAGKTRDGEPVQVSVRMRGMGTLVTVHVGRNGDAKVSGVLLDGIAARLDHPTYAPGSREESDAMRAFFGGVESRETLPSIHKPEPATAAGPRPPAKPKGASPPG